MDKKDIDQSTLSRLSVKPLIDAMHEMGPSLFPPAKSNLSLHAMNAIETLGMRVRVGMTDKGMGVGAIGPVWYDKEALRQLGDPEAYEKISCNPIEEEKKLVRELADCLEFLDLSFSLYVRKETAARIEHATLPEFFMIIKIHKNPIVGRPIIPLCSSLFSPLHRIMSIALQPFSTVHSQHIIASAEVVRKYEGKRIHASSFLATADVSSLCTSLDQSKILEVLFKVLNENKEFFCRNMLPHIEKERPPYKLKEWREN
mmetsp:Transcript_30485/g.59894  ORF Transcript_30485/g.59894 Transcript_30485/m.59894 type:complete len:258 (+) Transcript_30485:219-992(+)